MRRLLWLIAAAVMVLIVGASLINHPNQPVSGVDVSHYQGNIDWPVIANQGMRFAFVKATEGSSFLDEMFVANWNGARAAELRVGAYHFFSYDSTGQNQAANFIARVPIEAEALPPVIDMEFYGPYDSHPAEVDIVIPELRAMIDALTDHYGVAPILYATRRAYDLYLTGRFEDCDIWIRSVWGKPRLSDGRHWTFWQYSDRGRLAGFDGAEKYIDLNVYCGTIAEFEDYPNEKQDEK